MKFTSQNRTDKLRNLHENVDFGSVWFCNAQTESVAQRFSIAEDGPDKPLKKYRISGSLKNS